jgi:hypothetical protein
MPDMSQLFAGMNPTNNGSVAFPTNQGHPSSPGSGIKSGPSGPSSRARGSTQGPTSGQVAAAVAPPRGPHQQLPPATPKAKPPRQPRVSAQNPMLMVQPPPIPHPGVQPAYPDARTPDATLMANGSPIMPSPHGFLVAGAIPRVPPTIAPSTVPGYKAPSLKLR